MGLDEVREEIRSLIREPQLNVSANPWEYDNNDLIIQIRSALRRLRLYGITTATVDKDGTLTGTLDDVTGLLLASYVAFKLINGDLTQKLLDGELGLVFRAGTDMIDTKTATIHFREVASDYKDEYDALLAIALTSSDGISQVFGEQAVPPDSATPPE